MSEFNKLIQDTKDGKHLYQRIPGGTIFFQIRRNGRKIVETTGTNKPAEARLARAKLLLKYSENQEHRAEVSEAVTVAELIADYVAYLKTEKHAATADGIEQVLNKLSSDHVYKGRTAATITAKDNRAYRAAILADGRSHATANNHLSYLRSAFIHGMRRHDPPTVDKLPHFPIVKTSNARNGYIEEDGYQALLKQLPDSLKPFFVVAYHSGSRKAKLLNLKWSQVHFDERYVEFDATQTENKHTGILPFYGDVEDCLRKQKTLRDAEFPGCEWVFFWHTADIEENCVRLAPGTQI